MSKQELLSTLRDVNPIPDPDRLLIDEAEAHTFLATVQERRHGMANKAPSKPQTSEVPARTSELQAGGESTIRRQWRPRLVFGLAATVLILGVVGSVVLSVGDESSDVAGPQETVEAFYAAFNAGDIPAATMEFFTEESEIVNHPMDTPATRGGPLVGLTAIEETLQRQRDLFVEPEEGITVRNIEGSGETVTWDTDLTSSIRHLCAEGHSAVVKDGKILTWTHAPQHTCAVP